jgi:hypothetical protein
MGNGLTGERNERTSQSGQSSNATAVSGYSGAYFSRRIEDTCRKYRVDVMHAPREEAVIPA